MKYTKEQVELLKIGAPMMTWGIMLENYISALDEIKRLQSENEWIPVSERLPENFESVQVRIDTQRKSINRLVVAEGQQYKGEWSFSSELCKLIGEVADDVTFKAVDWRPLPASPESEG